MTRKDLALKYADRGWMVFPLGTRSKAPIRGTNGFKGATLDRRQLEKWWQSFPNANIGIATGEASGFFVLDVDDLSALEKLETEHHALPATRRVVTPSGGFHFFFKAPSGRGVATRTGVRPGLDVRGDGGYVVAPGSRTGTGRWRWDNVKAPIANAPTWLLKLIDKPKPKVIATATTTRHSRLLRQTWRDRANGLPEGVVLRRAVESSEGRQLVAEQREDEIRRMVKGAFEKEPDHFHMTDLGNARRFIYENSDIVRFSHTSRSWLVWNGRFWERDTDAAIDRLAKDTVLGLYMEAADCTNDDVRKRTVAHAARSEKADRIAAMLRLAQSEREVAITEGVLNRDDWALNVDNGTLDLRTGALRRHDSHDLLTYCVPITYEPRAEAPRWRQHLERVLPDPKLRAYLQAAIGYALTGSTREQCFFVAYGKGANGNPGRKKLLRARHLWGRCHDSRHGRQRRDCS